MILSIISIVYRIKNIVSSVAKKPVLPESGSVGSSRVNTILFAMITTKDAYSNSGFEMMINADFVIMSLIFIKNFLILRHGHLSL